MVKKETKKLENEIKKEVKEAKKEAKKEIDELKTSKDAVLQILIQTLAKQEKSNKQYVISLISLVINIICWVLCFMIIFQGKI